jgi:hypothetical protein
MRTDLGIEFFGWNVVLGVVAALMFGIYAILVCFFVWFGLDHVGVWVLREVRNDVMQIVQGVAGGLPLLLVFAIFFVLTAETWEVVVETDTTKFLSLVGLMVALTVGVLFLLANQQLSQALRQLTGEEPIDDRDQPGNMTLAELWDRLRKQALRKEPSRKRHTDREEPTKAVRDLFNAAPRPSEKKDLSPVLERRMQINALVVIAVYQALVLVPVGLSALLLFWGVGRLAVSNGVAAEWIYGDNAGAAEELKVDDLSLWGEPWTRVPVVIAAFSVLYLAVTLLTNKEHRTYFFSAASEALRQRLAVRVAYHLQLRDTAPAPASQEVEREREEGATAPPRHQPAAVASAVTPDTS